MLAVSHSRFGPGNEVAELSDVPEPPAPASGEVLIAMEAAPINPSNLLRFEGRYGNTIVSLPMFAGGEGCGRVLALGPGVRNVKAGDLVLVHPFFANTGTWRERLVMPAASLVPLPEADLLQLSMLTVNPPTALAMLTGFVDLQPGDWAIQNAANSAVGHCLVKLAAARNIQLINVVRRADATAELNAFGARHILVDGADLPERVAEMTKGALPRLAIDAVAGEATQHLAASVAEGGVVVNYGMLSGEPCKVAARDTVFRDVALRGFWLERWWRNEAQDTIGETYRALGKLIVSGELAVPVEASYPLAQVKEALAHAARPHRSGKIILTFPQA